MKKIFLSFLLLLAFTISCTSPIIDEQKIAQAAEKVAQWQINNFSYLNSGNLHDYGIDAWTNGVFYLGLAKWASVSAEGEKYLDWLYHEIGQKNNWQIPANFINYPKYGIYHADELCVAQFYLELFDMYKDHQLIEATKNRLDSIMENPPSNDMSFHNKQSWTWCDAVFMAPPVYLGIARIISSFSTPTSSASYSLPVAINFTWSP